MSIGSNATSMNQSLQGLMQQAGSTVSGAIQRASARTGVDFGYLLQQANVESSFNPSARAGTSSATGLYQFVEGTWLDMVRKYGDQYGLGGYASQISDSGTVSNSAARKSILALRKDPEISAYMAAEFAAENRTYLAQELGRSESSFGATDLYMAHFLGAGGAAQFLEAAEKTPLATAADIMPQAARANKSVFYQNGRALSVAEVYDRFATKFAAVEGAQGSNSVNSVMYGNTNNDVAAAAQTDPYSRFYAHTAGTYAHYPVSGSAGYAASRNSLDVVVPSSFSGRYLADPVQVAELAAPEDGWSRFARAMSSSDNRQAHNTSSRYNS